MKKIPLIILSCLLFTGTFGQVTEFKQYPSGLMYSDTTMRQLATIIDSLHIKFKSCELHKTYYSIGQAKAHFVQIETGNIRTAKKDIENGIDFEAFVQKYPQAKVERDLLVTRYHYTDYDGNDVVRINSLIEERSITVDAKLASEAHLIKGHWVLDYWEKTKFTAESVRAFFFTTSFETKPLPESYARMVLYSECMVDTTVSIFKESAYRSGVRHATKAGLKVLQFMNYVNRETNRPEYDEKDYMAYAQKMQHWDSIKTPLVDNLLSKSSAFANLLNEAVAEALVQGGSSDEFEWYVGRYHSRKAELELKRGRIVVGGCSMDDSPRLHAFQIAVLSAETVNWETFLRAHLDIMNDRFERVSDGSYAWAQRQTYIRELEVLDIQVLDLLLGISLRIGNPSQHHYFGNVHRIGRALSETKFAPEIEAKMLEMIRNPTLDDYNRMVMYYLFDNYNYYLTDDVKKKENAEKLAAAAKELPAYLAKRLI